MQKIELLPFLSGIGLELSFPFIASASAMFTVSVVSSSAFPFELPVPWVENSLKTHGKNKITLASPVEALTYLFSKVIYSNLIGHKFDHTFYFVY